MADWPRDYHPVVDGVVDRTRTVRVFAHVPGDTDALYTWCDGGTITGPINAGPVYILPGRGASADRLVGLGDVVVETWDDDNRCLHRVLAHEISARLWPADVVEPPPVD